MQPDEALKVSLQFLDEFEQIHKRNYEQADKQFKKLGKPFTSQLLIYGLFHDLVLGTTNMVKGIVPQALAAGDAGSVDTLRQTEEILDLGSATACDLSMRLSEAISEAYNTQLAANTPNTVSARRQLIWDLYMQKFVEFRREVFKRSLSMAMGTPTAQ